MACGNAGGVGRRKNNRRPPQSSDPISAQSCSTCRLTGMSTPFPAELLAQVFALVPPAELLVCMRVSRRWHQVIRRFKDWELERRRYGVWCTWGSYWYGREMSTGQVEVGEDDKRDQADPADVVRSGGQRKKAPKKAASLSAAQADALAELARTLATERRLKKLCSASLCPNRRSHLSPCLKPHLFNGQHMVEYNGGSTKVRDPRSRRLIRKLELPPSQWVACGHLLPGGRHLLLLCVPDADDEAEQVSGRGLWRWVFEIWSAIFESSSHSSRVPADAAR